MQSLVMSALAMAMLMKSSEIELGRNGRELALTLRDRARACLEHACNTRTPDYQMAGAALVRSLCCSLSCPAATYTGCLSIRSLRYSRHLATLRTPLIRPVVRCSSSTASSTSCRSTRWIGMIPSPAASICARSLLYTCLTDIAARFGVLALPILPPQALRPFPITSLTRPRTLPGIPIGLMWTSERRSVAAFAGAR